MDEDRRIERLLKHIEQEEGFVAEVEAKLQLRERDRHNRRVELYKEWQEKVFGAIQSQIDRQLASLRTEDISARRRALMEDYITISNRKRMGLYRDIIIESEYDPLTAHRTLMKYVAKDADDPLKQELLASEMRVGGRVKRELGRATLSATMWDRLHATPYGRFDRMMAVAPSDHTQKAQFSRVNFDHYNVSTDPADLDREYPRGKRIHFPASKRDQRSSTIFDT